MKLQLLSISICAAALTGCISTPQTKVLITPVGAAGIHSFRSPEATPPSASEIDRMTARLKQSAENSTAEN